MKHLLLSLIFSTSLTAFSQTSQHAICYHNTPACMCNSGEVVVVVMDTVSRCTLTYEERAVSPTRKLMPAKPDTLRAICLVSLFPNGIAHARMGYVVIEQGKRPVYLDCRKRALKKPQVGWGYELVNPNYKK